MVWTELKGHSVHIGHVMCHVMCHVVLPCYKSFAVVWTELQGHSVHMVCFHNILVVFLEKLAI